MRYLFTRVMVSIPTLVAVSVFIYLLMALSPGDPLSQFAMNPAITAEVRENIRRSLGLDKPLYLRYLKWAWAFAQGDWSWSFMSRTPVRSLILQRFGPTVSIVGVAYVVGILLAFPLGVLSAIKRYSLFDQIATFLAFMGFSLPTFFSGMMIMMFFSIRLGWLPYIYDSTIRVVDWPSLVAQIKQSIMPMSVLGIWQTATMMRYVRSATLDVLPQDYVRTARSKGLTEVLVSTRHVLRNALIPVVTLIALQLPVVFTGALITEQVFSIPGIGSLLIKSIYYGDVPVVMAITMVFGIMVVVFNLLADILYAWLDPRIRYTR
ncbi:MAG: ABC transporter permease [Chloroflexi bacterium]|nr:ABC transporter permease [Chloroflexota bacterium]